LSSSSSSYSCHRKPKIMLHNQKFLFKAVRRWAKTHNISLTKFPASAKWTKDTVLQILKLPEFADFPLLSYVKHARERPSPSNRNSI
jgi:hypothetical protein